MRCRRRFRKGSAEKARFSTVPKILTGRRVLQARLESSPVGALCKRACFRKSAVSNRAYGHGNLLRLESSPVGALCKRVRFRKSAVVNRAYGNANLPTVDCLQIEPRGDIVRHSVRPLYIRNALQAHQRDIYQRV